MFSVHAGVIHFKGEPLARLLSPGPTTTSHVTQDTAIAELERVKTLTCASCGKIVYKAYCEVCK